MYKVNVYNDFLNKGIPLDLMCFVHTRAHTQFKYRKWAFEIDNVSISFLSAAFSLFLKMNFYVDTNESKLYSFVHCSNLNIPI